jgi:ATP diphosphatase
MDDNTQAKLDAEALGKINDLLDKLLGPQGCPWDKEQSVESLCEYALEEMYELVDAVRHGSAADRREEMGDVFFILFFMARLSHREGQFSLSEILEENCHKMISRHPHVFENLRVSNQEDIFSNWEKIKRAEKAAKKSNPGVFASLPVGLPPLLKAYRIHSKSARNKFTWDTDMDAEQQVEAEWLEWIDARLEGDEASEEHEFGDLLFSLVELGRRRGIKANEALDKTNTRFLRRFAAMEKLALDKGLDFSSLNQVEKDQLWAEVKATEK